MFDREMSEEQEKHRGAVDRANELFELYERARAQYEGLEQQFASERRAHDATRDEMVALKVKTSRMVELVANQKRDMEARICELQRDNGASSETTQQLQEARAALMQQKRMATSL